jgi:archaellum component FlaC
MTIEEMITDLKQFIATTVRQEVVGIEERLNTLDAKIDGVEQRLNTKIDGVEQRLSAKIDDVQAAIGDVIVAETERVDRRFDDHEKRILRLEHRAA